MARFYNGRRLKSVTASLLNMHKRLATTDFERQLHVVSKGFLEVADQSQTDFINTLALKSSVTVGVCSVSINRELSCHPDIILPQALKEFAYWSIEVVGAQW